MGKDSVCFSKFFTLAFLVLVHITSVLAQMPLRGRVVDKNTRQPIIGATIRCMSHPEGASTGTEGTFLVYIDTSIHKIEISAMGYESVVYTIADTLKDIVIPLSKIDKAIETVEITRKGKYNRKNPATEIIDLIIDHKKYNKLSRKDSLYYRQYEKLKFGMVNPAKGFSSKLGDMSFFFENLDTTVIKGQKTLAIYMEEEVSDNYVKQNPSRTKQIVIAEKKTIFDPRYINNNNIQSYLNYIIQPVDVYDESIYFLNKLFLSPIADNAKVYYKYRIVDTVWSGNDFSIRVQFEPFNKQDLLFSGMLEVSMDGRYAVENVKMSVGKEVNLSWVSALNMELSYFKNNDGVMLQGYSHVVVQFGNGKSDVMFGERISVNDDYNLEYPISADLFTGAPTEVKLEQDLSLNQLRPISLNTSEKDTYLNVDQMNQLKSFRTIAAVGYLVSQGYFPFEKFELGPLEYLFHRNNIEGGRLRLGGRTTAAFSEKVYLQGYLAYGFRDEKFKYYLRSAVSLNGKSVTTFPAHYVEGMVQHDIFAPGRGIGFLKGDSFFRSFGSNRPNKWLNVDAYRLGHLIEFGNHVSVNTSFTHTRRVPIGDLAFISSGDSAQLIKHINTNDIEVKLRWAPFEKFYYRNLDRTTIEENHPVFSVQYNKGLKGFWGGDYGYDALRLAASKRFFMNQVGFGNVTVSGGKIWGALPYPLLEIPNVEDEIDRNTISYERVNSMEFVADEFIKVSYDHRFNGFIMNKIPFLKKLKLRENFGVRMFYGKLSDHNNPALNDDVVYFDRDNKGMLSTNVLGNKPYWEGYFGFSNILRVFRVDYYKRLNYNSFPNATNYNFWQNLRVSLQISF